MLHGVQPHAGLGAAIYDGSNAAVRTNTLNRAGYMKIKKRKEHQSCCPEVELPRSVPNQFSLISHCQPKLDEGAIKHSKANMLFLL